MTDTPKDSDGFRKGGATIKIGFACTMSEWQMKKLEIKSLLQLSNFGWHTTKAQQVDIVKNNFSGSVIAMEELGS